MKYNQRNNYNFVTIELIELKINEIILINTSKVK